MPTPRPAAFFDLDETLLSVNSAKLWIRHLWEKGEVGVLDMLRFSGYLLRYKLALIDIEKVTNEALRQFEGKPEDALRAEVHAWYDRKVRHHLYAQGRQLVEHHRSQGHHLVLLTAASPYLSERVVEDLKLDHFLCTRPEVVDGHFTGRFVEPLCYGEGKIVWAEQLAKEHGMDIGNSFFYTDSFTDLPMLRRVGNPIATNPDPRLRRLAAKEGMPIRDFDA